MTQPPAGWYDDPDGVMRWWDGIQWTEHTQPPAGPPQQQGGPTPSAYPPQQGQQQPPQQAPQQWSQQPQQQWSQQPQQQWPAYGPGPGGKPPRKTNPALIFGIGGGVLALLVAAIVIVLVTRDGSSSSADHPLTPSTSASAESSSASPSTSPSESPTDQLSDGTESTGPTKKGWPAGLPTDAPHTYPRHDDVVGAPKDASVHDFCRAQKMILDLPDGDTNAYYAWFWYRVQIGTPADMSDAAREGWMEDVSVDDDLIKKKFKAFDNYEYNKCY